MTDRVLELLRQRPGLAQQAAFPFDFDLGRAEHGEDVLLASGAALEPVAGDDTGGTFFVCAGGPVLYASSEGEAGLLGDTVSDALEIVVGLPAWRDLVHPAAGSALARELEDDMRSSYAPDLDDRRKRLRAELGLPERSCAELIARLHTALRRTDPDHVLLNAHELSAYELLGTLPRTPLWDVVLAPGRAALGRLRSGGTDARDSVATDPVLRAGVLRAAQYDRRETDLPLLRFLLRCETAAADGELFRERWLAAVLLGLHGREEDVPLIREARGGALRDEEAAKPAAWAAAEDAAHHGQDPATEDEFVWTGLARRQGRTELARAALIRMLDDTGPDAKRLTSLAREFEALGDHAQAARSQRNVVALQDTAWDRAVTGSVLARLERRTGDLNAAWRTLGRVRTAIGLDGPVSRPGDRQLALGLGPASEPPAPDACAAQWHRRGLGRVITEQHLELVLAAIEAGRPELAREAMSHGKVLLRTIDKQFRRSLGELPAQAKWAVAALPDDAGPAQVGTG